MPHAVPLPRLLLVPLLTPVWLGPVLMLGGVDALTAVMAVLLFGVAPYLLYLPLLSAQAARAPDQLRQRAWRVPLIFAALVWATQHMVGLACGWWMEGLRTVPDTLAYQAALLPVSVGSAALAAGTGYAYLLIFRWLLRGPVPAMPPAR